jgi:hypothetical protein
MHSSEQELTIDTRMLLHATFQISSSEVIQCLIAGLLSLWQVFTRILLVDQLWRMPALRVDHHGFSAALLEFEPECTF